MSERMISAASDLRLLSLSALVMSATLPRRFQRHGDKSGEILRGNSNVELRSTLRSAIASSLAFMAGAKCHCFIVSTMFEISRLMRVSSARFALGYRGLALHGHHLGRNFAKQCAWIPACIFELLFVRRSYTCIRRQVSDTRRPRFNWGTLIENGLRFLRLRRRGR